MIEVSKRLNLVVAVIFLVVGILATANTVRLNNYIREAVPRDTAQEACQLATLQALRVWATGRGQIEEAKTDRDTALYPMLEALARGERPSPELAAAAQHEFAHIEEVRRSVREMLLASPIPDCKLVPR